MTENLKQFIELFNQDENIQLQISNGTQEGLRLLMINDVIKVFNSHAEIEAIYFDYKDALGEPINKNEPLPISVIFHQNYKKDLKNSYYINESLNNKFSYVKFNILKNSTKEDFSKNGRLKLNLTNSDRTPNTDFYKDIFSLALYNYPLFQYFMLHEKVENKELTSVKKLKI